MLKYKKILAIVALPLLMILSAIILLPIVQGSGETGPPYYDWPNYDACGRCEHSTTINQADDTFCISEIQGFYDGNLPAAYTHGQWDFYRGYGGQGAHDYITPNNSPMFCSYAYGNPTIQFSTVHYEYGTPQEGYGPFGNVHAWYQQKTIVVNPFGPARETQLQGGASSYFTDPDNPSSRWYVSAMIPPSYVYAHVS